MSMSTDVVATRRAVSASRLRSNQAGMIYFLGERQKEREMIFAVDSAHHRRGLNDSLEENSHRKFPFLSYLALIFFVPVLFVTIT